MKPPAYDDAMADILAEFPTDPFRKEEAAEAAGITPLRAGRILRFAKHSGALQRAPSRKFVAPEE